MPEVKYIQHGDKSVLLMDYARITDYGILPGLVEESIRLAQSAKSHHSVLALVDLSGTRVNKEVIASLKRLSRNNGSYIQAIAFVGLSRTWSLLLSLLLRANGKRNHRVIHERSQALQWLILQ
jgi:hypothetical protein